MKPILVSHFHRLKKYFIDHGASLIRSSFWLNANFVTTTFLGFIFSLVIANYASKETYGLYQYILSTFSFLGAFTLTGMNTVVTKAIAQGYEGALQQSIRPQLFYGIIPSFLGIIIAFWYLFHGNNLLGISFLIMGTLFPITSTFNTYNAFLVGKKLFKQQFFFSFIFNIIYYGIMIAIVFVSPKALWLVLGNLILVGLFNYIFYKISLKVFLQNNNTFPDLLSDGLHLSISNILPTLLVTFDNILVYYLLGPVMLAIYSIISVIPLRVIGLARSFITASIPDISRHSSESIRPIIVKKIFKIFIISSIIGIGYIITAPLFFKYLFPTYKPYAGLSIFFTVSAILSTIATFITSTVILTQNKTRVYVFNTLYPIITINILAFAGFYYGIIGIITGRIISSLMTILLAMTIIKTKEFSKQIMNT